MTCPKEQEVLAGAPGGAEHAAVCTECAESLQLLGRAKVVLAADLPTLSAEARSRMWAGLEEQPRRAPLERWTLALSVASAAALVAALLIYRPGDQLDRGEALPATLAGPATVARPGLLVEAAEGTELSFQHRGDDLEIFLDQGRVDIDLEVLRSGTTFAVITPFARVETAAARFNVTVDPRAAVVTVERGSVSANAMPVGAGQSRRFEPHPQAAAVARAQEPAEPRAEALEPDRAAVPTVPKISRPAAHSPEVPPEALARRADELRRAGELTQAAAIYRRLEKHAAFAEEALLRQARLYVELDQNDDARAALSRADDRFPRGALTPERTALRKQLDGEKEP